MSVRGRKKAAQRLQDLSFKCLSGNKAVPSEGRSRGQEEGGGQWQGYRRVKGVTQQEEHQEGTSSLILSSTYFPKSSCLFTQP